MQQVHELDADAGERGQRRFADDIAERDGHTRRHQTAYLGGIINLRRDRIAVGGMSQTAQNHIVVQYPNRRAGRGFRLVEQVSLKHRSAQRDAFALGERGRGGLEHSAIGVRPLALQRLEFDAKPARREMRHSVPQLRARVRVVPPVFKKNHAQVDARTVGYLAMQLVHERGYFARVGRGYRARD